MANTTYVIKSKKYGIKECENKELLIEYMTGRFPIDAVKKVKEWKDVFDGRELGESYIDEENEFFIMSTIWD